MRGGCTAPSARGQTPHAEGFRFDTSEGEGSIHSPIIIATLYSGKTFKNGKPQNPSFMRNSNIFVRPVSLLAPYLYERITCVAAYHS
jgi:hypothetical protein